MTDDLDFAKLVEFAAIAECSRIYDKFLDDMKSVSGSSTLQELYEKHPEVFHLISGAKTEDNDLEVMIKVATALGLKLTITLTKDPQCDLFETEIKKVRNDKEKVFRNCEK